MIQDVTTAIREIVRKDPRYKEPAYEFVFEALQHTLRRTRRGGHVSGQELLDGAREYALDQYGYLARVVLENWGIHECLDIGEIVFNLVGIGLMRKTDDDSLEDFRSGYDFEQAFELDFRVDTSRLAL